MRKTEPAIQFKSAQKESLASSKRAETTITIDTTRLLSATGLRHVEWLEKIDSTNDRALALSRNLDLKPPFLIGADEQSSGRGRGSNRWWGAEGSLMFSIAVDMPDLGLPSIEWPRFSLITGLAISETLSTFMPTAQVGLKWPNDVWLNGRKVCGILIEQADRNPDRFIVGIGINVNNSFVGAPDDQRRVATSMKDESHGGSFPRTQILIEFITRWNSLLKQLAEGNVNLVERWSHSCVLSGRPVTVTSGNHETTGICTGINDDGSLMLRTAYATERCYAGTVKLLD